MFKIKWNSLRIAGVIIVRFLTESIQLTVLNCKAVAAVDAMWHHGDIRA
jgi:hypothetical protein